MKPSVLLPRLSGSSVRNVAFQDLRALLEFVHPEVPEIINLQDAGGEAKPYQIRQFLRLVERYNLRVGATP